MDPCKQVEHFVCGYRECSLCDFINFIFQIILKCLFFQILQCAVNWLNHDWNRRKTHALEIMKKIRLGRAPADELKKILGEEMLSIPECKGMVEEVLKLHAATKETAASVPLYISHPDFFATRNTVTVGVD